MKRQTIVVLLLLSTLLYSCIKQQEQVITVKGKIAAREIGKTLHHEHLLVDFIGADSTGYHRWNKQDVVNKVLPYLLEIKELGYSTLIECTPEYLGRDPELLRTLSEQSGIHILTNVGYYSAIKGKFLPQHAKKESAQQLANRWIEQIENGIEHTGIYPGFIKIAVERAPLQEINKKVVEAACLTHKASGLTIMSHTGLAVPAFQQLDILKHYGIHPSAFIWTHANNEKDNSKHLEAARKGVWIAFDKFEKKHTQEFVAFALLMKNENLLNKLLFSHDAGWYKPGQIDGGNFRGFTDIEYHLIPALLESGLNERDIKQLFEINPAKAFAVKVRLN
jgi:phosphotriesterase-related protein